MYYQSTCILRDTYNVVVISNLEGNSKQGLEITNIFCFGRPVNSYRSLCPRPRTRPIRQPGPPKPETKETNKITPYHLNFYYYCKFPAFPLIRKEKNTASPAIKAVVGKV